MFIIFITTTQSLVRYSSQTLLTPHCVVITKGTGGARGARIRTPLSLLPRTLTQEAQQGWVWEGAFSVVTCMWKAVSSTHPLAFPLRLLERNSWGSWPGSCPFLSPCLHLEESMGPSSPPPGECLPGPCRARDPSAVHIAVYLWGACLHQRGSVRAPGGGACAAHVVTHDMCGFTCGGKKHQPPHLMSRGAEG